MSKPTRQDDEDFKIDKGIPMPPKSERGKWMRLHASMKVGDSVLLDHHNQVAKLRICFKRFGAKVRQTNEGNKVRVWRVS